MPRRKFAWAALPDEKLLQVRLKDLKVRVEHTEDILKTLNAIKDAGGSFLSLDVRRPNLEEVFLKLTGEALHAGPAEGGEMV